MKKRRVKTIDSLTHIDRVTKEACEQVCGGTQSGYDVSKGFEEPWVKVSVIINF